jgi:beta-galactosidase
LDSPPWILNGGAEIGSDGLLSRKTVGNGVAIFCQVDPDRFPADEKTYFHYTRWRSTRAVAQLLANLGASFPVDKRIFQPRKTALDPDRTWIAPNGDRAGHDCDPPIPSRLLDLPPTAMPEEAKVGYYHPDYRTDFPMGDNPYRYYRW